MIKERYVAALAVIAVLAACGGGGGGGSSSLPSSGGPGGSVVATATPAVSVTASPSGSLVASVSITLPKGTFASSVRRGQAIGTGTQSIVFTLLQQNGAAATGTPQPFGLTASSPGCTLSAQTGNLGCVLPVNAPIGSDVFLAQTYTNSNGTGSLTGSGALALTVGINATNTATIVLNAQVAAVYVVAGGPVLGSAPSPAPTTIASMPVFVVAVDSAGNTILNPSAYSSPIYLQLSFYSGYTPDVTLKATYAANDPSPCIPGGTATASTWFANVPICSPSDAVSALLSPTGGANPSFYAYVYGYTSTAGLAPTPAPSTLPSSLPSQPPSNSFAAINVTYPTPAGSVGTLPIVGQ